MIIPTLEQMKAVAEVLITWGFWIIVYGAITMFIGLALIIIISAMNNKQLN